MTSTTPICRFNSGATADRPGPGSIFCNDSPPKLEVEAQRHDRIGIVHRVGQLAVKRSSADVSAKVKIAILHLADQIVGDRISDAAAGGQTAPVGIELIDSESE